MEREQLEKMTLEALRILAAEQGVDGAAKLGKTQLIERLTPPPALIEHATVAVEKAAPKPEDKATRGSAPPQPATGRHARGKPARASFDIPSSTVHPHADELETLTMARLYLAEGHTERALEIFEKLSALEPEDQILKAQVVDLRKQQVPKAAPEPPATPSAPPAPGEPLWMLDLEELPETYGLDECEVLYKDPFTVFAYWEVTDHGMSGARAQLGPSAESAKLVLRLFTTVAQASGVERHLQDVELPWNHGRRYLQSPRPGAHLRIAVGLLSQEGYFAPIAHSSLVRVPSADPSEGPVEWMEVLAGRSRGHERESLVIVRRGQEHSERGLSSTGSPTTATWEEQAGTSRGRWNPTGSGSGGVK